VIAPGCKFGVRGAGIGAEAIAKSGAEK